MQDSKPPIASPAEPATRSFAKAFSQSWAPPLVVGLLAASSTFLLTLRNEETTRSRAYLELKVRHADATAQALSDYVSVWRRVIIRCDVYVKSVAEGAKLKDPVERMASRLLNDKRREAIAKLTKEQRAEKHDLLFAKLDVVQLYFSDELVNRVVAFRDWDDAQQTKSCWEMPEVKDYRTRQIGILNGLKKEVRP